MTAVPAIPGSIHVTVLTGNERVNIATAGPQTADTSTASIAALAAGGGNAITSTSITTVGNGVLTAAGIVGGVIVRSGPTGAYTDTTATAAQIIAAMPTGSLVGASRILTIKNLTAFAETLSAGSGVTLSGNKDVIPANSAGVYLVTYATASTVTIQGLYVVSLTVGSPEVVTALTTVGAGTITAAGIVGGVTTRGGAQSGAAFSDTTATADQIIAAAPNSRIGESFEWTYRNNTDAAATIGGGTGATVSVITVVPKNSWAKYLVTYTAASTVTIVGISAGQTVVVPAAQYATAALQSTTMTAAQVSGASFVNFDNTGTTPANLQFPAATDVVAAIPNCQAGFTYMLAIRNSSGSANTATITTNTGVTLTGTMTIAQTVTRYFVVTINSLTTLTVQSMGISAAGA